MKQVKIPPMLHDVFGERQYILSIVSILLFGVLLTAMLYWMYPEMTSGLPIWRKTLALLFMFDVFSGCVANFTASTSNFYASRRKNRIVFIAIHFHIVIISMLLNTGIVTSIAVWAYTIAGAYIVNMLIGKESQKFVAGLLLSVGIGCTPMLPHIQPYMLIACQLFMLKVLFGFAVDHYGKYLQNNREIA